VRPIIVQEFVSIDGVMQAPATPASIHRAAGNGRTSVTTSYA
jgi:hypothetical protein